MSEAQQDKLATYSNVRAQIEALIEGETDSISIMSTVACELHHAFDYFNWTGFYRTTQRGLLKVGPYQGTHGCLRIPFERGVCGKAARTQETQWVPDVESVEDHIACSSTTRSEVVVPVVHPTAGVVAVLDVDSNTENIFDTTDVEQLEQICKMLGDRLQRAY